MVCSRLWGNSCDQLARNKGKTEKKQREQGKQKENSRKNENNDIISVDQVALIEQSMRFCFNSYSFARLLREHLAYHALARKKGAWFKPMRAFDLVVRRAAGNASLKQLALFAADLKTGTDPHPTILRLW